MHLTHIPGLLTVCLPNPGAPRDPRPHANDFGNRECQGLPSMRYRFGGVQKIREQGKL
jgi:hypothetical protein